MYAEDLVMKVVNFKYYKIVCNISLQLPKSFMAIVTMACIFLRAQYFFSVRIESIQSFVTALAQGSTCMMLLADVLTYWVSSDTAELYNGIAEALREDMNEHLKQSSDPVLAALAAYKWLTFVLVITALNLGDKSFTFNMSTIAIWLCHSHMVNVAILKHLLVKRLRAVRTMAESSTFLDQVVTGVRQVLKSNSRVNCSSQSLATAYSVWAFFKTLRLLYILWLVYGVNLASGYNVTTNLISASLLNLTFHSSLLLLVMFSSSVSDEIDEIKDELDVTMTARPCTKQQQKMISLLLLELGHKPIQFSALGLFTINRISLVTVIAALISYMLVFIQFS